MIKVQFLWKEPSKHFVTLLILHLISLPDLTIVFTTVDFNVDCLYANGSQSLSVRQNSVIVVEAFHAQFDRQWTSSVGLELTLMVTSSRYTALYVDHWCQYVPYQAGGHKVRNDRVLSVASVANFFGAIIYRDYQNI